MRTGKELILATREFAKEDRQKSWFYTLSTLFLLILLFVGSFWNLNFWLRLACSLAIVFVQVRMFVIYHDFLHGAILQRSRLAKTIFSLFGLFTLTPTSIWKHSHDHHHNHNSKFNADIGTFPIITRAQFLAADKKAQTEYLAVRHPLTILFAYFTMFLFGMCLHPFLRNRRRHFDCLAALIGHFGLAFFLIWMGGMTAFWLTLFILFNLSFIFGTYLFYAQHNFPDVQFRKNIEWSYENAALESSSFLEMGRFMRWATGNIGFHHIHHLNSRIPFYRLPEAMARIPELQKVKKTSLYWREVAACLRLKVWDPNQNRMIGLREI